MSIVVYKRLNESTSELISNVDELVKISGYQPTSQNNANQYKVFMLGDLTGFTENKLVNLPQSEVSANSTFLRKSIGLAPVYGRDTYVEKIVELPALIKDRAATIQSNFNSIMSSVNSLSVEIARLGNYQLSETLLSNFKISITASLINYALFNLANFLKTGNFNINLHSYLLDNLKKLQEWIVKPLLDFIPDAFISGSLSSGSNQSTYTYDSEGVYGTFFPGGYEMEFQRGKMIEMGSLSQTADEMLETLIINKALDKINCSLIVPNPITNTLSFSLPITFNKLPVGKVVIPFNSPSSIRFISP